MQKFTVAQKNTLEKFLENSFPELERKHLKELYKKRDIKINGIRTGGNCNVELGDVIEVYIAEDKLKSEPKYKIIFEDKNIIVCDKAAGINSEAVFESLNKGQELYFLHRLDRNTSGLMIFAKGRISETILLGAFKNKNVIKKYKALCYKCPVYKEKSMTAYLKKDAQKALVSITDLPLAGYAKIETAFRVLQTNGETSVLEIELLTGKTHQIRAHMAHIGNFIIGDGKYGIGEINRRYNTKKQCLVAKTLSFKNLASPLEYLNGKVFESSYDISACLSVNN